MKEEDLEKNLENLIIDGLIKECEQDNADFEAAMRIMSDEDFEELIYRLSYKDAVRDANSVLADFENSFLNFDRSPLVPLPAEEDVNYCYDGFVDFDASYAPKIKKSKWQIFRPWIVAAIASVAVVLIVLIPCVNAMNDKLCDSAFYASQSYITPAKGGFDISSASIDEIKERLPELTTRYENCLKEIKRSRAHYSADLQEAGWNLTLAYLKLHKKGDAVKVLKVLSVQYKGSPFGEHCQKLIDQL